MMNRPVEALQQSYLRTKATDLASFMQIAQLKANSSNNTIFADDKGEIAYLHPQFVPRRDDRFDYTKPVDGSDPATDRGSLHSLSELPNVVSPPNGWVDNNNNAPWPAAGAFSPKAANYPKYMDMYGENFRGVRCPLVRHPGLDPGPACLSTLLKKRRVPDQVRHDGGRKIPATHPGRCARCRRRCSLR